MSDFFPRCIEIRTVLIIARVRANPSGYRRTRIEYPHRWVNTVRVGNQLFTGIEQTRSVDMPAQNDVDAEQ